MSDALRTRLATAEAHLSSLRTERKAAATPAPARLAALPTRSDVQRLRGSLMDVLAKGGLQARQRLQERLQPIVLTPRVRGDEVTYVMELTLKMPTAPSMMEAPSVDSIDTVCGGLIGTVQHTGPLFVADIGRTRGTSDPEGFVRVLPPRLAA